jgi:RNA polymerase sigma-54 factor
VSLDNKAPEDGPTVMAPPTPATLQTRRRPRITEGEPKRDEMDFSRDKEFEILGKLDEDWRDHMASVGGTQPYTSEDAERRQHFFDSLVSETSLQEHLMQQAEISDLPPALEAMRPVGSLDDRGFHPDAGRRRVADRLPSTRSGCAGVLRTLIPRESVPTILPTACWRNWRPGRGIAGFAHDSGSFRSLTRRRILNRAEVGADADDVQSAIEGGNRPGPAGGLPRTTTGVLPDVPWNAMAMTGRSISTATIFPADLEHLSGPDRQRHASKQERDYHRERMPGKFLIDSIEQRQRTIGTSPAKSSMRRRSFSKTESLP